MKTHINTHGWDICFFGGTDSAIGLEKSKTMMRIPPDIVAQAYKNITATNAGSTISNISQKCICSFISEQTSKAEMLNTLSHEIRHIVDIISEHGEVESPAELTGEITAHFADWV